MQDPNEVGKKLDDIIGAFLTNLIVVPQGFMG